MCSNDTRTVCALVLSSMLGIFGFLFSLSSASIRDNNFNFTGLVLILIAAIICVYLQLKKEHRDRQQQQRHLMIQQIHEQIQLEFRTLQPVPPPTSPPPTPSPPTSPKARTPLKYNVDIENIDIENLDECSICLETINAGDCFTFPCGHRYHIGCITKWYEEGKTTCPNCRQNFP